jgi:hypothetical protein
MRTHAAVALLFVSLAAAPSPAADPTVTAESAHYRLVSTGKKAEAEEWAKVLETAWPQFERFFGAAPKLAAGEKLRVAVFETFAALKDAAGNEGVGAADDEGGWFDPRGKAAYASRRPTIWSTRTALLHQAAHQFHQLARVGDGVKLPTWYGEGVAEHLAHHTWDGEHLKLGAVPMLSLEDRPGRALDASKRGAFNFDAVLDETSGVDRASAMHVVRYLCDSEGGRLRPKFDAVAASLDKGQKVGASEFAHAVGAWRSLLPEYADWLSGVQQTWESIFVDWDNRGDGTLRGSATVMALCKSRRDARSVSARVIRPRGSWRAGVLLRYGGPKDYVIGMIGNGRSAYLDRLRDGEWQRVAEVEVPAAEKDTWRVEGRREGESVRFLVNGQEIADIEAASGPMGLAIDNCAVDFTEIVAR